MEGWIKLDRKITNHWIWKDPVKLKWWIDILLTVNHADQKVNIGNQLFDCKRGQTIMSLSNWAERWGVTKDSTRNFMVLLQKDGMILHESLVKTTRITVCNYDTYQGALHADQTQQQRNPNAPQTQGHTNNKDNNGNNDEECKEITESIAELSDKIYKAYPTRCPFRDSSTGKTSKDKETIKKLLKKHSFENLMNIVNWYVDDSTRTRTYLKNFSTFLKNLPEIPEGYKPKTQFVSSLKDPRDYEY